MEPDLRPQYPIGAVAQRTGLSTHVLRAWERRYAVVEPGRSGGGTRLYSNADIVRLRLLRRLTELGHPIGQVARLSREELLDRVREEQAQEPAPGAAPVREPDRQVADEFVAACLEAVEAMDSRRIHGILMRAVVGLRPMEFVQGVVGPLLRRVGELWAAGEVCPAHEHVVSVCVQRVLHWLMDALPVLPEAPVLVCTTPAGERHEVGAMLAGVVAADLGWRVLYFGPDLAAGDIARAVEVTSADAVALSVVCPVEGAFLRSELETLRGRLARQVPLLVGGPAAADQRPMLVEVGAAYYADLSGLRAALLAHGSGTPES